MTARHWKLLVNGQPRFDELHLQQTALLIYEVEVRARLEQRDFPIIVSLVRVEAAQETVVLITHVTAPAG